MFEALHRQPRRNPRIHMRRGRSLQPSRGHMDWGARVSGPRRTIQCTPSVLRDSASHPHRVFPMWHSCCPTREHPRWRPQD